nr:hypothetical protein [uncultured Mediterranean phage uvMED]
MVKDPITEKTEIVVKFTDFESEDEAMQFAELFQLQSSLYETEKNSVH